MHTGEKQALTSGAEQTRWLSVEDTGRSICITLHETQLVMDQGLQHNQMP